MTYNLNPKKTVMCGITHCCTLFPNLTIEFRQIEQYDLFAHITSYSDYSPLTSIVCIYFEFYVLFFFIFDLNYLIVVDVVVAFGEKGNDNTISSYNHNMIYIYNHIVFAVFIILIL